VTLRNAAAACACAVVLAACSNASVVPPQGGRAAQSSIAGAERVVGSVHLKRCFAERDYYCGTLRRPLDPAGQVPGTIDIAFAWLPHSDARRRASGTIVAVEGGPGYPSIGSRALYRGLYAPLLATRDLLVVDNRGTGASDVIDCPLLQRAPLMKLHQVAACGAQMGKQSDLFGTGIAADDMAAVLRALGIARVDLYGDSYGTFFVQAFAGRHPRGVNSIVLDGAYPVTGASPWYPSTGPQMRDAFDLVCRRSDVCSKLPGSSPERIVHLVAALRQGKAPKITPADLAFVMDSAGLDPLAYRDLDAAARALLDDGDLVPLTRLVREAYAYDEGAGSAAKRYSQGSSLPRAARIIRRRTTCGWNPASASSAGRKRSRANEPRNPISTHRFPSTNTWEYRPTTRICRCACRGRFPRGCTRPANRFLRAPAFRTSRCSC
jgi:pimeloyl-ACP methyl ester carboxylesterase